MIEDLYEIRESAREELKRADHSIFVSLKYIRTVEILKSTIRRLISAFELAFLEILEFLKNKKKIKAVPGVSRQRAELVLEKFPHLKEYIEFYYLLKDINNAEYTKREEYRKNVTLICQIAGKTQEINIERLIQQYEKTAEFVGMAEEIVKGVVKSEEKAHMKKALRTKKARMKKKK